jgi:hypothetical protein
MQKDGDTHDTGPISNGPRSGALGISLGALQVEPLYVSASPIARAGV